MIIPDYKLGKANFSYENTFSTAPRVANCPRLAYSSYAYDAGFLSLRIKLRDLLERFYAHL